MPHVSELHGAATHLAVVAIPVFVLLLLARRADLGGQAIAAAEPWVVGAAVAGTALAGITGLLAWGQAKTELRDGSYRLSTLHFWLGIALAVIVVAVAAWRYWHVQQDRHTHGHSLLAGGLLALAAVLVQGYVGGRMTYDQGVGVQSAGQYRQSAAGAERLELDLAHGMAPPAAGQRAFSRAELGCAECHGDKAEGERGPQLAGGVDLTEFRHVHGEGLFPTRVVSDSDFGAIEAWLRSLPRRG